ncbi:MAG: C26 family cysteine hydrolase domain-containing family, partial [Ilumatobacter sp.]|nr:C26 family cysteine hydrolase domain-containing family [Ilumatobacter sp.]
APGFAVTARCPDGVVEAIESVSEDWFAVGTQFHPEAQSASALDHRIFEEFIDGVKARHSEMRLVAVVVDGTGHGHGRGMSQWGAYGYAVDEGKSWQWILDHYFGGTQNSTVPAGQRIRVRLLALDGQGTVGVVSHGAPITWNGQTHNSMYAAETSPGVFDVYGSSARSCPGAAALTVPDGPLSIAPTTFKSTVRDMQLFLDIYHDSAVGVDGYFGPQTQSILTNWQTGEGLTADGVWDLDDAERARAIIAADGSANFTLLGTETTTAGDPVSFTIATGDDSSVAGDQAIGVCGSNRTVTHYRGSIDVLSTSSGNRVVNDVLVEDYVRGVVPKEVSASWATAGGGAGINVLRAQAVAARSYGLQQRRNYFYDGSSQRYATTCDTTSCQVYAGAATRTTAVGASKSVEHPATDAAITATARTVRTWKSGHPDAGGIVSTEFSASNGPRTAGGTFPVVDDTGDDTPKNPNHRWTRILDADMLESRYGLGQLTSAAMTEAAGSWEQQFDGIWFNDVVLAGTSGTERIEAWDFRNAFGLPSPGFTVRVVRADAAGTSFAFIGDSVANSIASDGAAEFDRLIDGTFTSSTIIAQDSRCTTKTICPGPTGVQAAADLPDGVDLVLVELGYNDDPATFAADIDAMMTALVARNVGQVVWVNLADIRPEPLGGRYRPMNEALAAAPNRWPNLTVLDWNAASSHFEGRARWFSDGVHLTVNGQAEFALWLRGELLGVAPNYWLSPPKRIVLPIVGKELTGMNGELVTVPADATSVALNVTAHLPVGPGYVTVWPCETARPTTSNLNYEPGDVVANNVVASIDTDGAICLYSHAGTDLIVDVSGWFTGAGAAGAMVGVTPERVVDTRTGFGWPSRVLPSTPLVIDIAGMTATRADGTTVTAPADVAAVSLNVTAVTPDGPGFLTVWPCDGEPPLAASVNYEPGAVAGNGVLAALDDDGRVCIYSEARADVVVDVQGWFTAAASAVFTASRPKRIVDTRFGTGAPQGKVSPSAPLVVPVHGVDVVVDGVARTVPSDATAAVVNVVAFLPDGDGYVTVWPCTGTVPLAANIVYGPGAVIGNGVIAPISADGTICLYTHRPADLIVDISGWLAITGAGGFTGTVPGRFSDTRYRTGPVPT